MYLRACLAGRCWVALWWGVGVLIEAIKGEWT